MPFKTVLSYLLLFFVALSVCMIGLEIASSRVLDPGTVSPEAHFLATIAPELGKDGIDTVYGRSSDYPLAAGEVRIAPLAGFKPNKREWGSYLKQTWMAAFQKGAIGFLAVVPNNSSAVSAATSKCLQSIASLGTDVCEFVRKWLASPPAQRVFIAFTRDDFEHAQNVKSALEKTGFTVFLFLKDKDGKPWADPAMVGEVFAQAQFRMVIDTANARGSPGVALEHECCGPLLLPDPPATPLSRALQGQG